MKYLLLPLGIAVIISSESYIENNEAFNSPPKFTVSSDEEALLVVLGDIVVKCALKILGHLIATEPIVYFYSDAGVNIMDFYGSLQLDRDMLLEAKGALSFGSNNA